MADGDDTDAPPSLLNILKFKLGERSYEESARLRTRMAQFFGRPTGQLAGTFVMEMAGLRKMLCLCDSCHAKFGAKRAGYRRPSRPPLNKGVISECDDCREWGDCNLYVPEEHPYNR